MEERAHEILVGTKEGHQRIDRLISSTLGISRHRAQCLILGGRVTISGLVVNENSRTVKVGDVYMVSRAEVREQGALLPNPNIGLNVVYEDSDIIVIDKEPYIAVHPGNGTNNNDTIANALLAHCGAGLSSVGSSSRPGIVHRLDKDTSGLMVAAKTESAYYGLFQALANGEFRKEYLAVAWGVPRAQCGTIQANIRVKRSDITMMEVTDFGGKPAKTDYKVEQKFGETASIVRCMLHTGRTHQIRVHLSHIGHSIVGDQKYGKNRRKCLRHGAPDMWNFHRQALHAHLLGFRHPRTGQQVEFISKPSRDIQELIATLEALTTNHR
ncbi:RluA family pseudouridine synthase [Anaplasma capra]|uniref:RluA family pseudouridine synthase n=1 Tax=Anaplasma capra TaxID=1562740 RepID=UPI0021D5CB0B|nr:RluA family pseudouridine synthase [Anaplasma capra]MCU7611534.1 RluA family pseudouridine synthase [Anaplasma capra]MCU7612027.1 RluA family pseudouridine synthase [Anaplasma capra]